MAKYRGRPLKWRIAGKRHRTRSLLLIVSGPILGLFLTAAITGIDHTGTATNPDGAQTAIAFVSLFSGIALAGTFVVIGIRGLRRFAVGATADLLVITAKRRTAIPLNIISAVAVSTPSTDSNVHAPGVILANGAFVGVPDAESANQSGVVGVIDVDDELRRPRESDLTWRVALEMRAHLTTMTQRDASKQGYSFSPPSSSSTVRSTSPPGGASVTVKVKEIGLTRKYFTKMSYTLIFPFLFAFQLQEGSHHAFNVAQYVIGVVVIAAMFALLTVLPVFFVPGELRIGFDWLAVRNNFSRKWTSVRRDEVIGITMQSKLERRTRNMGPSLEFTDSTGRRVAVTESWLTASVAEQILAAFGSLPLWQTGVKEKIVARTSAAVSPQSLESTKQNGWPTGSR